MQHMFTESHLNKTIHVQRRHLRGRGRRPPPPQGKRKKKNGRKKRKRKEMKKGTMNNVKLLHIKCCIFQFAQTQTRVLYGHEH